MQQHGRAQSTWRNMGNHLALRLLGEEDPRWQRVIERDRRYLNNIVEQDHRAIERRCASMLGFKSFGTTAITLAGAVITPAFPSTLEHQVDDADYGVASLNN